MPLDPPCSYHLTDLPQKQRTDLAEFRPLAAMHSVALRMHSDTGAPTPHHAHFCSIRFASPTNNPLPLLRPMPSVHAPHSHQPPSRPGTLCRLIDASAAQPVFSPRCRPPPAETPACLGLHPTLYYQVVTEQLKPWQHRASQPQSEAKHELVRTGCRIWRRIAKNRANKRTDLAKEAMAALGQEVHVERAFTCSTGTDKAIEGMCLHQTRKNHQAFVVARLFWAAEACSFVEAEVAKYTQTGCIWWTRGLTHRV